MRFGMTTLGLMLAAALMVGCGDAKTDSKTDAKTGSAATEGDAAAMAFANTKCPLMGGEVDPEGEYSVWDGKKIGYCCDGCKEKFDELTDEEKEAKLAETNPKDESQG